MSNAYKTPQVEVIEVPTDVVTVSDPPDPYGGLS